MIERLYVAFGFALWFGWHIFWVVLIHRPITFRGKQIWKS